LMWQAIVACENQKQLEAEARAKVVRCKCTLAKIP